MLVEISTSFQLEEEMYTIMLQEDKFQCFNEWMFLVILQIQLHEIHINILFIQ